ncbi:MAG: PilT/PilU family type 4a pilus ATPase [Gammaproteobacteria bacterium]|nr:PilT/PilU family type 4a pilus ATPase [Gammaproteobacteria bacterium]
MSETTATEENKSATNPQTDPERYLTMLIKNAIKLSVSDIHIKSKTPPFFRLHGNLHELDSLSPLSLDDVNALAAWFMNERQRGEFERDRQIDLARGFSGIGRVRANIFSQRGSISIVLRVIPTQLPDRESLHLPPIIDSLSELRRGLVLVTGPTGSGKSTTLATMIDIINRRDPKHIVTIEDPIEFLFRDQKSIISQREVGPDTDSFTMAMRAALRQDPDVIFIGELRDAETITTAIKAADTGHLVLSTLHASGGLETVNRIMANFPVDEQETMRMNLATNLRGVVSQRLLPTADGKSRVCAYEVLVGTRTVSDMIEDPKRTAEIENAIRDGAQHGMISFDACLLDLAQRNVITDDVALDYSTNPTDLRLKLEGF